MNDQTIFDPNVTEINVVPENLSPNMDEDYSEYLEKYNRDEQAIGKALYHKDTFIDQLKSELSGLRQDLQTRIKMEEFLDKMNATRTNPLSNGDIQTHREQFDEETPPITAEDVKRLLNEQREIERRTNNVNEVINTLKSKLGNNYSARVKEILNNIGYDETKANQLAADSPKAFLRLVGLEGTTRTENFDAPPRTQLNITQPRVGSKNKYSDYQRLHQELKSKNREHEFWSPKIQNEIMRQAELQGESFYLP